MACKVTSISQQSAGTTQPAERNVWPLDERRTQLDSLRLLAFLFVFLQHSHGGEYDSLGHNGVRIFFAISGFLITRILVLSRTGNSKVDLGTFYARRALRIIPPYYLVLLVCLWLKELPYAPWFFSYLANFKEFIDNSCLSKVSMPFWSLCVEEQFYLFYPLLLLFTPKNRRLLVLVCLFILSAGLRFDVFLYTDGKSFIDVLLIPSGVFLIAGCIGGLIDAGRPSADDRFATPSLLGGALLLASCIGLEFAHDFYLSYPFDQDCLVQPWWTIFWGFPGVIPAIACGLIVYGLWRTGNRVILSVFQWRPAVYLGKISYGMYLIHALVLVEARQCFPGLANNFVAFGLTVLFAALMWELFEKPINNLKRHLPYVAASERQTPALPLDCLSG